MNSADVFMMALCIWREARSEGYNGMLGVAKVIYNRSSKQRKTVYDVVVEKWQFSSITAKGDPQATTYPGAFDLSWQDASKLANRLLTNGNSNIDTVFGATLYYDDSISFPASWDKSKVQATAKIGRLNFFKEI